MEHNNALYAPHIYDLRHNVDQDDWELGMRVACALFAENRWETPAARYDAIARRASEAQKRAKR